MAKAGEQWNNLSAKDRKPYEEMVAKDQQRYQRELDELIEKGFFIYEKDGKSSADVQKKIKKDKKKEDEAESPKEEKIEKVKREKKDKK